MTFSRSLLVYGVTVLSRCQPIRSIGVLLAGARALAPIEER